MGRRLGAVGLIIALLVGLAVLWRNLGTPAPGAAQVTPSRYTEAVDEDPGIAEPGPPVPEQEDSADRTAREQLPREERSGGTAPALRVLVLGPEGAPVEGASVRISNRSEEPARMTDHGGVAIFPEATNRGRITLRAEHGDLVAIPMRVQSNQESVTLHLLPTETLTGRVLEAGTENPVPDAEVLISQIQNPFHQRETSDGAGRVTFEGIPRGVRFHFQAWAPGHISNSLAFNTHDDPLDPTPELVLRLERAVVLHGRVVDAMSGAPISDARVSAGPNNSLTSIHCDEHGEFRRENMITAKTRAVRFIASAPGYCALIGQVETEDWSEPVEIRLPPSARLRVRAFDSEGLALENARIRASIPRSSKPIDPPEPLRPWIEEGWSLGDGSIFSNRRLTSSEGHLLEMDRIPYSDSVRVSASAQGHERATARSNAAGAPGSIETLDLVLAKATPEEPARVHGILRLNGAPTPGQVSWTAQSTRSFGRAAKDGSFKLRVSKPGTVTLTPLPEPPGLENLSAYFDRGKVFADRSTTLEVSAGETREVDLDVEVPMGFLSGRLVTSDGRPVPGRTLHVESSSFPLVSASPSQTPHIGRPLATGTTEADGHFSIEVPTELAPYRIAFVQGGEVHSLEIPNAPRSGIDFELPTTRRVTVRRKGLEPSYLQRSPSVFARSEGTAEYRTVETDIRGPYDRGFPGTADGSTEFELPLGTYDLLIGNPNSNPAHFESVELTASPTPLEIVVEPDPLHRLTLTLAEGSAPIPTELTVLILEESKWDAVHDPQQPGVHGSPYPLTTPWSARGVRFAKGSASTGRPLTPGRYRFKVFPPDISIEPEWFEMGSRDQSLEIRWD